jgi:hypothetical protein
VLVCVWRARVAAEVHYDGMPTEYRPSMPSWCVRCLRGFLGVAMLVVQSAI